MLGVRTIFNLIGPLTNPASAKTALIGVYAPELTEMFAQTLNTLGVHDVMIVHGHDGMDEITLTGPTRITEMHAGEMKTYNIYPELRSRTA